MIKNFLLSLITVVSQWIKGLAGVPLDVMRSILRVALSILRGVLDFIGMIVRPAMRFLAYTLLMIATVALVADLTPLLAGMGGLDMATVGEHWRGIAPGSLQKVQAAAGGSGWFVARALAIVLESPTCVVFALLGGLASLAGRRPERVNVFAN